MEALQVLDWRRRVTALYADVRNRSETAPRAAHALWRSGRDRLFAEHPASPLPPQDRSGFTGLPVAPYDPDLRLVAEARPVDAAVPEEDREYSYPTGTDGVVAFTRAGTVDLTGVGEVGVWWHAGYGGGIFLPLRDGLAGERTFGGGRYVLDTVKGADLGGTDGSLVVDLNFAYNPSCAYDPEWACPLAPPANQVPADVLAGELLPG